MKTLGELCNIVSGGTPLRSKTEFWDGGTIPWIKISNIKEKYVSEADEFITEEGLLGSSAKMLNKGTVLYTIFATLGEVGILKINACTNQAIAGLTIKDPTKLSTDYLYYYLKSKKSYVNSIGRGVAQNNINMTLLKKFVIPLPNLLKQNEIVGVLDNVSNIIDIHQKELKYLDELVKARFVEMFGNPVINSRKWKTEELNSIAPISNFSGNLEDKVWLLNLDMIEPQTGRIIDYLYVSIDEVGSSTCKFDTDNVLYSKLRPYLNKVVIPDRSGYATSELVPLRPKKSKLNRVYLAFLLRSNEFVNMINEKVAGAKMPRVSMTELKKFRVPVPPIELQNEFAEFTKQVDKSREIIQKKIDTYQELFDKLMQEYFG